MRLAGIAAAYLAAVLITTVLGAILQTQFNLAAIAQLGAPVPLDVRLDATAHDLLGFSPTFGAIVAAGFLIAFAVTAILRRWRAWSWLYPLAGGVAVLVALQAMALIFEITPVAAARGLGGLGALVAAGVLGGWSFWRLLPRS